MRLLLTAFLAAAACTAATSVPSLPAWFESAGNGRFVSRGAGGHLVLDGSSAELSLPGASRAVKMSLKGADSQAVAQPLDRLPGNTNYLVGSDRSAWRTGVEQFGRVMVPSVYKDIDLIYYAQGRELEYDFILAPGADASRIRLVFEGAQTVRIASDGALLLEMETHLVRQAPPVVYQETAPGAPRRMIAGRYVRLAGNEFGFQLGAYNRRKPLVIDPVLGYTSYMIGSKVDTITAMAPAVGGGIWVAGMTNSYVTVPGTQLQPFSPSLTGAYDVFVARVVPSDTGATSTVVTYTFLGGSGTEEPAAIAVDAKNRIYVTGYTGSTDFPKSSNAPQTEIGEQEDAFLTVLDTAQADTAALIYSTYFGGKGRDFGKALAMRPNGNVLVVGNTTSGELPNADSTVMQRSNRGGIDAFLAEFNLTSGAIAYSTFLGGDGMDSPTGVVVAANGQVIVTGLTSSTDYLVAGSAYNGSYSGRGDAFITVVDTSKKTLDALVYSTYFGGNDLDYPTGLLLDKDGSIWIGGYTFSRDLPASIDAVQTINAGSADLFLARFDLSKTSGAQLTYCTYFGGSGSEVPYAMAFDGPGRIAFGGYTMSRDYPMAGNALPAVTDRTSIDAFVTTLDTTAPFIGGIVHSGIVSSPGIDVITSIARDGSGNLFFGGYTSSLSLPVTDTTGKTSATGLLSGFTGMIRP